MPSTEGYSAAMSDWPHAPLHRLDEAGTYFITASTYLKQRIFNDGESLNALQDKLFAYAKEDNCWLQAWSLFSNHYHLIVNTENGPRLHRMLKRLHADSAIDVNARQRASGRKVWFQFRDTQLTFEKSWLARLRYTHENAVHHRIVANAEQYPWCSASWFAQTASPAFTKVVKSFKIDRLNVYDDF